MLLACIAAQATTREQCERQFAPLMGQSGKDVIWIPTLDELARAMLKAAGTPPRTTSSTSARATARFRSPRERIWRACAWRRIQPRARQTRAVQCPAEGLTDKVEIRRADIFETDFSQATVLTLYLLSDLNMRLRPTILKMRPGTRVVSTRSRWATGVPIEFIESEIGNTRAYLWIVPAHVAGTWRFAKHGGADVSASPDAALSGDRRLAAGRGEYFLNARRPSARRRHRVHTGWPWRRVAPEVARRDRAPSDRRPGGTERPDCALHRQAPEFTRR